MKNKFEAKHIFFVPNLLSIIRILLVFPVIIFLKIDTDSSNFVAIIIFIILILTDYFDGYFSRKLNQVTELGKILDPIADKVSLALILITLVVYRNFPISLLLVLLFRDLFLLLFGLVFGSLIVKKGTVPEANWYGKINTALFFFTILLFILNFNTLILTILVLSCYVLTIVSGISYYVVGEKILCINKSLKYILRVFSLITFVILLNLILHIDFTSKPKPDQMKNLFPEKTELIHKYAPILYFAKNETFFPTNVNLFLDHSQLLKRSFFLPFDRTISRNVTSTDLKEYNSTKYYLKIDRKLFDNIKNQYNNLTNEYPYTIYARAVKTKKDDDTVYILQYWFFYWASKAGSTNITWHECDWEMVMFYLDENFSPIKAGYSQHYYGEVVKWEHVGIEDGRPIVYVSRGGHSAHFSAGKFRAFNDNSKKIPLGSDICAKDIRMEPKDSNIFIIDDSIDWVNFKGFWGIPITTKLKGPKYRNPKNRTLSMWTNSLSWFEKYEKLSK